MHSYRIGRPPRSSVACLAIAFLSAALVVAPVRAVADARAASAPEGVGKLIAYLSCAVSIVLANEPAGAIGAAFNCIRTLFEELKPEQP